MSTQKRFYLVDSSVSDCPNSMGSTHVRAPPTSWLHHLMAASWLDCIRNHTTRQEARERGKAGNVFRLGPKKILPPVNGITLRTKLPAVEDIQTLSIPSRPELGFIIKQASTNLFSYLFESRKTHRGGSHLLFHSLCAYNGQGWAGAQAVKQECNLLLLYGWQELNNLPSPLPYRVRS